MTDPDPLQTLGDLRSCDVNSGRPNRRMLASTLIFILFSPAIAFVASGLAGMLGAKRLAWFVGSALVVHFAVYLVWRKEVRVPLFADLAISTVIAGAVGYMVWRHFQSGFDQRG